MLKHANDNNMSQRRIFDRAIELAKEFGPPCSGEVPCHHRKRLNELIKELCERSNCDGCQSCFWEGKDKSYAPLKDVVVAYGCGWGRIPSKSKVNDWDGYWEVALDKLQESIKHILIELERWLAYRWQAYKEAWLSVDAKDPSDGELILPKWQIKSDAGEISTVFIKRENVFSGQEMNVEYQQGYDRILIKMKSAKNGKSKIESQIDDQLWDGQLAHFLTKTPIKVNCDEKEKFPENSDLIVNFRKSQPILSIAPPHPMMKSGSPLGKKSYPLHPSHPIKISAIEDMGHLQVSRLNCDCGHYDCAQRHRLANWSPRGRKKYNWLSLKRYISEAVQGARVIEDLSQRTKKRTQHPDQSSEQEGNKDKGLGHSLPASMWFQMRQSFSLGRAKQTRGRKSKINCEVKVVNSEWYGDNGEGYWGIKIFNLHQQRVEQCFYWRCKQCQRFFPIPEIDELQGKNAAEFRHFLIENFNQLFPRSWGKRFHLSKRLLKKNPVEYNLRAMTRLCTVLDGSFADSFHDPADIESFSENFSQHLRNLTPETINSYFDDEALVNWLPPGCTKERCAAEVRLHIIRKLPPDWQRSLLQEYDGKCLLKVSDNDLKSIISSRVTELSVLVKVPTNTICNIQERT